jgi:hypothetical protein
VDNKLHKQCRLRQLQPDGTIAEVVAWIPEKAAVSGYRVELKGEEGLWNVCVVTEPSMPLQEIKDTERAGRKGLQSIST